MESIEKHIVDLIVRGDNKFVALLYDNYADSLYGIVLRILGDERTAKDVMQDSFTKVWKNAGTYDPEKAKLFTWLLTIFRNTAIDRLRAIRKKADRKIQTTDLYVYDNRQTVFNIDSLDIKKHLSGLDTKYVEVIEALFFRGLTQKEASESLQIPLGTVKTRLKIGLRMLRNIYDEKTMYLMFLYLMTS